MRNIPKPVHIFMAFLIFIFAAVIIYLFLIGKIRGKNYLSVGLPLNFKKFSSQQEVSEEPNPPTEGCSEEDTLKRTKLCTFLIGDIKKHGSGFLINPQGYLVTNYHVINHSEDGYVDVFYQGDFHGSRIVGFSVEDDIAVIKISSGFTDCQWTDSDNLKLAETVYAIGWPKSPYGDSTITKGIFSRYAFLDNEKIKMIQTDSPINPGNSGGPLINSCGVVGINTSKITWIDETAPSEGLGYAISSNYAKKIVQEIISLDNNEPAVPLREEEPNSVEEITEEIQTNEVSPDTLVSYDFEQVIFWEQRIIHDETFLKSWDSAEDSDHIDQNKLQELINQAERCLQIAETLWDGYTNSKITYMEAMELKNEYLLLSKRMMYLSNELNISGSINAYKNCIESWEKLEDEYQKGFSEQKDECENIIHF